MRPVTFYKDALMTNSRLLANSGLPAAKRFLGRLTGLAELPPCGDLTAWISEAMELNGQGIKLPSRDPKTPKEFEVPAAFATQLEVLAYRRGPVMDRRGQAAVLEICQAGLTSGRLIWRPELGKFW